MQAVSTSSEMVGVAASAASGREERVAPAAVVAAVAGDLAAQEAIYREYLPVVRRWSYRMTRNSAEADDLTQDVMIKLMNNIDSIEPVAFESWLYRVTMNLFLDRVRRSRRIVFQSLPENTDWLALDRSAPDLILDDACLDADVAEAVEGLGVAYRDALVMRDVYGFTYEEIALRLDVPVGTVRSRIHRARGRLRTRLPHRSPERYAA